MTINFSMSKVMKSIDFFSHPFSFKINNQNTIKSFLGGILTLHLIGILVFFGYMFGNDIFYKQKPSVLMYNSAMTFSPFVNFTRNNSVIALRLEDENGFPVKEYSKYVTISISFVRNIPDVNGYKSIPEPLKITPCDKNLDLGYLFNESRIEEYFCISNYNINIGGYWGKSQYVNYIRIEVDVCKNTTENNNSCAIYGSDLNYFFNLYISDGNVNLLSVENPIEYKLTNIFTRLDPNFNKISNMKYSNIEVDTDTGFLFKSSNNSTSFFLDSINIDFSSRNQNPLSEYYLYLTNKKQKIMRSYIKLQDIGAQLGGITQILMIIFTFLLSNYQEKLVTEKLMNQLFRYSKNELGEKQEYISDFKKKDKVIKKISSRTRGRNNFDIIESRIVTAKNIIKDEKIESIIQEMKNSKRFRFTNYERIISVYLCKFFHSKKIKIKDILADKSKFHLNKFLNVNVLFEKIMEIDILKFLIFNKEQMMVFNFLEKPEICVNKTKINSNFSKMIEKLKIVNKESAYEIIEYFLKFSKKKLIKQNSIDSKLFEILQSNLRDLVFSFK